MWRPLVVLCLLGISGSAWAQFTPGALTSATTGIVKRGGYFGLPKFTTALVPVGTEGDCLYNTTTHSLWIRGASGWEDYKPSPGVTDHSALSNLSYAASGHTGFLPTSPASITLDGASYDLTLSGATPWFSMTDGAVTWTIAKPAARASYDFVLPSASGTFWNNGNDGAGSGLDADTVDGLTPLFSEADTLDTVTGRGTITTNPIYVGDIHTGYSGTPTGADGRINIYSEQGATDYSINIKPNPAMTSDANIYLPADEPSGESLLTMGTDGIVDYTATSTYLTAEVDGVVGNEVTNATDSTLTRSGSGTGGSPYTLGINLGNANTWTAEPTVSIASDTAAELMQLTNSEVPLTTETTQAASISFDLTGSVNATPAAHEAARIEAYKVSDWFHASDETDHDSGLKFYTTVDGTSASRAYLDGDGLHANGLGFYTAGSIAGGDRTGLGPAATIYVGGTSAANFTGAYNLVLGGDLYLGRPDATTLTVGTSSNGYQGTVKAAHGTFGVGEAATATTLLVNPTTQATGYLADFQVGSASKAFLTADGYLTAARVTSTGYLAGTNGETYYGYYATINGTQGYWEGNLNGYDKPYGLLNWSVTNAGTNVAFISDTQVAMTGTTKLWSFREAGTEAASIDDDGAYTIQSSAGIGLSSAGVVKVTDGSTGYGNAMIAPLTAATMTAGAVGQLRNITSQYSWTNAMVVALGANLTGDIKVCTLPAKTVVKNAYIIINTAASGTDTLTVSLGRTGATYLDYLGNGDAMAAANTVYGDAVGERGANLTGYDMPSSTATTDVYCHFIATDATGDTLEDILTSTGTVYLETVTLP